MASNEMKKAFLFSFVILCLTVCYAHAQIKWDAAKFMPLSEVKPGRQGKGYQNLHFSKLHALAWRCRKMLSACVMELGLF